MLDELVMPHASPARKVAGYHMPEDTQALLSWEFVAAQMAASRHHWLTTIATDGQPHAVPLWGLWFSNRFHFKGRMHPAWVRHLVRDPCITVHLPHGEQVVIIEGIAHIIEDNDLDPDEWNQLGTRFQAKYQVADGSPYWYVQPRKVLAWNGGNVATMTRWRFDRL